MTFELHDSPINAVRKHPAVLFPYPARRWNHVENPCPILESERRLERKRAEATEQELLGCDGSPNRHGRTFHERSSCDRGHSISWLDL